MTIEITGLANDRMLEGRITKRINEVLKTLKVAPISANVAFIDENGPKGGVDTRCALTVRLPYRPTVRVEELSDTPRRAFDLAFPTLERALVRYREVDRDRRRRPKKYFVAKRLLTGEERPEIPSPPRPAAATTPRRAKKRA